MCVACVSIRMLVRENVCVRMKFKMCAYVCVCVVGRVGGWGCLGVAGCVLVCGFLWWGLSLTQCTVYNLVRAPPETFP